VSGVTGPRFRTELAGAGFVNVWDCNQPDADAAHVPSFPIYDGRGHVLNGEDTIDNNAGWLEYFVAQKLRQFQAR